VVLVLPLYGGEVWDVDVECRCESADVLWG